jgi:hypothetical protein
MARNTIPALLTVILQSLCVYLYTSSKTSLSVIFSSLIESIIQKVQDSKENILFKSLIVGNHIDFKLVYK